MDDLVPREPPTLARHQAARTAAALARCGLDFDENRRLRAGRRDPAAAARALLGMVLPDRFRATSGHIVSASGAIGPYCDCLILDRMVAHRIAPEAESEDGFEYVAATAVVGLYGIEPILAAEEFPSALERLHEILDAAGFDPRKSCQDALLPGGVPVEAERGGLSPNPAFGIIALAHDDTLGSNIALSRCVKVAAETGLNFDLVASLSGFLMLPLDANGLPRIHSYDLPKARLHHSVFHAREAEEQEQLIWRALGVVAYLADNASGRRMTLDSFQQLYFAG